MKKKKQQVPIANLNQQTLTRRKYMLDQAMTLLRNGQASAAEGYFVQVLSIAPENLDALKWLGVIAFNKGRPDIAAQRWQQAIAVASQDASLHCNLGLAQQQLGNPELALASLDRALYIKPDFAEALNNRGNVLRDLESMEEAATSYTQALGLQPQFPEAQYNLGMTLLALKRPKEALEWLDKCLQLMPHHTGALHRRGVALATLHRPEEALASFEQVLEASPNDIEARFWHCKVLFDTRQYERALEGYQAAVRIRPDLPEAYFNLANVLTELRRHSDALQTLDQAIALRPNYVEALYNRAGSLQDLRLHEEAAAAFAALVELAPDHRYTFDQLFHSRQYCCDWTDYAKNAQMLEAAVQQGGSRAQPFSFLSASANAALQLQCAKAYANERFRSLIGAMPRRKPGQSAKRKVAYVSADLGQHPIAYLLAGVFEAHDRKQFETLALRLQPSDGSPIALRLDKAFDRVIDVSQMESAEIVALMAEQEVDIAVDLMGYTENCRTDIFAARSAPIQVNYLGYPGTMGAPYMDYLLADEYVIPPNSAKYYSEKVAYLPDCFQGNDDLRAMSALKPSREELGLPVTGFVFCAFNNTHKINPPLFDVWMRLLTNVSGSVLWLVASDAVVQRNLRARARLQGVDPMRLVFAPRIHYPDHLARMALADLFLDTLPFNAGTTASDALWAGLPVLTCSGEAFASRMAGSLLTSVGLPELIAKDLPHYESLALQLAERPETLRGLRGRLSSNRLSGPLFDTRRFCRHLEAAYQQMWAIHVAGEPPATFKVKAQPLESA